MDQRLPDGVWLGLPFNEYVSQPDRLGSTDKSKLHLFGPGWWWQSRHNPYYRPAQSPDMLEGEALHALLLEGMGAYESRFCVEPDKFDYPDLLTTIPAIKDALAEAGVAIKGSSTFRLEDWAEQATVHLPGVPVWSNILRDFHSARAGRKPISAEADFNLRAMHEAAIEDHPDCADVRELLTNSARFPVIAEVSVLYTDGKGRRHRARFDKIIPSATIDLKTAGAWHGRPFIHSVDDLIKRSGHDVQEADYQVARRAAWKMILEDQDRLHGGTLEERAHVLAMAQWDQTHKPHWSWIFFGKPELTGRAPTLFPLIDTWNGPYHRSGFRKRARALDLYDQMMERFGPDRPWSRVMPLHFSDESHEPHISHGAYGFDDEPVSGEAEHFEDGRD